MRRWGLKLGPPPTLPMLLAAQPSLWQLLITLKRKLFSNAGEGMKVVLTCEHSVGTGRPLPSHTSQFQAVCAALDAIRGQSRKPR